MGDLIFILEMLLVACMCLFFHDQLKPRLSKGFEQWRQPHPSIMPTEPKAIIWASKIEIAIFNSLNCVSDPKMSLEWPQNTGLDVFVVPIYMVPRGLLQPRIIKHLVLRREVQSY